MGPPKGGSGDMCYVQKSLACYVLCRFLFTLLCEIQIGCYHMQKYNLCYVLCKSCTKVLYKCSNIGNMLPVFLSKLLQLFRNIYTIRWSYLVVYSRSHVIAVYTRETCLYMYMGISHFGISPRGSESFQMPTFSSRHRRYLQLSKVYYKHIYRKSYIIYRFTTRPLTLFSNTEVLQHVTLYGGHNAVLEAD